MNKKKIYCAFVSSVLSCFVASNGIAQNSRNESKTNKILIASPNSKSKFVSREKMKKFFSCLPFLVIIPICSYIGIKKCFSHEGNKTNNYNKTVIKANALEEGKLKFTISECCKSLIKLIPYASNDGLGMRKSMNYFTSTNQILDSELFLDISRKIGFLLSKIGFIISDPEKTLSIEIKVIDLAKKRPGELKTIEQDIKKLNDDQIFVRLHKNDNDDLGQKVLFIFNIPCNKYLYVRCSDSYNDVCKIEKQTANDVLGKSEIGEIKFEGMTVTTETWKSVLKDTES